MKRILLVSVILAAMLLSACTAPATTPETGDTSPRTTTKPAPEPSAKFTITSFDPSSEYVYIYYDIENNGNVYLNYYKVYFTITCDDGSKIEYWTNGTDVLVGQKWSDSGIAKVGSQKVTSVEITKTELTGGTTPKIIYEITGTADEVDVTLNNATGGTEQYSNVSIPKKYSYRSFTDSFFYISAQNQGENGTVRVSIYVDGKLFKTSSSSGAYVIASASGSR